MVGIRSEPPRGLRTISHGNIPLLSRLRHCQPESLLENANCEGFGDLPDSSRLCQSDARLRPTDTVEICRIGSMHGGEIALAPSFRRSIRPVSKARSNTDVQRAHWHELMSGRMAMTLDLQQRVGARRGVEFRFPFLDQDLVRLALSIAPEHWPRESAGARIHRDAVGDILPPQIRERRSKGAFSPAVGQRLRNGADQLAALFHTGEWFSAKYVRRRKLNRFCPGRWRAMTGDGSGPHGTSCAPSRHLKLGFGSFLGMLPRVQRLSMSEQAGERDGVSEAKPQAYEPPVLVVIGNLRDLLAGNASRTDDGGGCNPGGDLACLRVSAVSAAASSLLDLGRVLLRLPTVEWGRRLWGQICSLAGDLSSGWARHTETSPTGARDAPAHHRRCRRARPRWQQLLSSRAPGDGAGFWCGAGTSLLGIEGSRWASVRPCLAGLMA